MILKSMLLLLALLSLAAGEEENVAKEPKGGEPGWVGPKQTSFSKKEKKKECGRYNGRYIGYYGKIYKIEKCKRRELTSALVKQIMKKGVKVTEVDGATIIKLDDGEPIDIVSKNRSCSKFNRKYVLSVGGDMYFIKNCTRYLFPDWESYKEHAKKSRSKKVMELSKEEFAKLKEGKALPSVLDKEYQREAVVEFEADVIPLKEACAGINGRYVSYYSKVYKIENCRKRELSDPRKILKRRKTAKVIELSSEQWISLPLGKKL